MFVWRAVAQYWLWWAIDHKTGAPLAFCFGARKHLSLRTWCSRLVRKGIRLSKRHDMCRIVVALVKNFWFFCRVLV